MGLPDGEQAPAASVLARIRLRHLQALVAVTQEGSVKGAAQSLSLSPPAVTKTLNELEEMLGLRLLAREREGARPTPQAGAFLRHAQASLAALREAVDSVGEAGAERRPLLRLGVLPTLAAGLVAPVVEAWRREWPLVTLRVVTAANTPLLALLRGDALDLVVGRFAEPQGMAGLSFEGLYVEPLVIAVRPGHPLAAAGDSPAPAALATHPWVLPPAGTAIRHAADAFLATHGLRPLAGVTETLSMSFAQALLQGGALWFTPASSTEPGLQAGQLRRLALPLASTDEPVGMIVRAEAPRPADGALRDLMQRLRDEGARRRAERGATAPDAVGLDGDEPA